MALAIIFPFPGSTPLAASLASRLGADTGILTTRKFPDGETYLRYDTDIRGKEIAFVCTLNDPNAKLVALLLAAQAARELGAVKIGLIAPYLAYMRQDARFLPGEAVTSRTVAHLISRYFDWLVTVDPHLHRYRNLSEIYSIRSSVVHAAPAISAWIKANVQDPYLVGPDVESVQWVCDIAQEVGAPYATLKKHRQSDHQVWLEPVDVTAMKGRNPVLVDDIISSGETMLEAVQMLKASGVTAPVCIAVHGLFADDAEERIAGLGAKIVTTNSIPGSLSHIRLDDLIATGVRQLDIAPTSPSIETP